MPSQPLSPSNRIAYVVKRYPRFSETFIVNEILVHEADGLEMDIFALRPSVDTHFQNVISQVRAPVTYLPTGTVKSTRLWKVCHELSPEFPELWPALSEAKFAEVGDVFRAIHLAMQVREKNISHLHAHFATSAATVAQIAARITGISYSVTMHAKDIFHESVVPEDLESKIADSKFVVTVSDFNRRHLIDNFGHPEKIERIYNGLDLELFAFNAYRDRKKKIISVGRLVQKKGLCHLIDACKILDDQGTEFECEIIGTGELESELRKQIKRLSLNGKVVLSGPMPQNVVREKISSAAVFAAPCVVGQDGNRDGLPTVITESLALGTPCVATDVTGIPEIIRHEQTGIIVAQEDSTQLAVQLKRLLGDPQLCQSLATNARALVEEAFDARKNVGEIRKLVQKPVPPKHNPQTSQLQGAR